MSPSHVQVAHVMKREGAFVSLITQLKSGHNTTKVTALCVKALAQYIARDEKLRDSIIENSLLHWMEESSEKLPDEVELQEEITYFIYALLSQRHWPLMSKVMPGIHTLSKIFLRLSKMFPFEQSKPDDVWKEVKASECLILILLAFENVVKHNHDLFEQLALMNGYHNALMNLVNYGKDLAMVTEAMGIISALCGAKR